MTITDYALYATIISVYEFIALAISLAISFQDHSKPKLSEYAKMFVIFIFINMLGLRIAEFVL